MAKTVLFITKTQLSCYVKELKKAGLTYVLDTHCLLFCHCLDNICMWTEREGRRDSTKYGVHKYTHTCGHYGGRECLRR